MRYAIFKQNDLIRYVKGRKAHEYYMWDELLQRLIYSHTLTDSDFYDEEPELNDGEELYETDY